MKRLEVSSLALRLRLALRATSPVLLAALLLGASGIAALAWLVPAREALEAERELARRAAAAPPPAPRAEPVASADANLALFYASLGEKRVAERQVRTLFDIAAKTGLTLRQGEYKSGYDRNGKLHTYQINLPVQGSYGQVWRFALLALRAIPFASLDDISFKRDSIGQAQVDARLRLTLYMADAPEVQR
ncbi:hypothetical protein LK540_18615 [Massilia sp. IC2-278]|uniref:hypothetical protein n=1 Tax=Massilia sp. IC2-278 TaxID=2887200 RepID=UPI001E59FC22|nr:hypothetical protein [Massilia sp. IC2-278]MCC2962444.1 hypothetical protein [Massilia sp. IC2-278]